MLVQLSYALQNLVKACFCENRYWQMLFNLNKNLNENVYGYKPQSDNNYSICTLSW
jgi:hypothetical protein